MKYNSLYSLFVKSSFTAGNSINLKMKKSIDHLGAKIIKKTQNSTQNKRQTYRAKQYKVTSFLSTDCELSTNPCSKNVYNLGPRTDWLAQ